MNRKSLVIGLALSCLIILGSGKADAGRMPSGEPKAVLLAKGLEFKGGQNRCMISSTTASGRVPAWLR